MKTYGGSGDIAPPFLTSALDEGDWSASRPFTLPVNLQLIKDYNGSFLEDWIHYDMPSTYCM
jgi:hypothetical protein